MAEAERRPLSGREYAAMLTLFATISAFAELTPILEKRAKMRPGLFRDIRMMEAKCDTLMRGLLDTVPAEKLRHIRAEVKNVRLNVKVAPPGLATENTEGFSYVPSHTLNDLIGYLLDHECMLCDKTPVEARKCWCRKALTDALPHEVEARDGEHCKFSNFTLGTEETV